MQRQRGTEFSHLREISIAAICLFSLLTPLHGQPPPAGLDLTEELLKLLLKDHPKILENRKLIDELKAEAPEARLAERDLECLVIELKAAKAEKEKIEKEAKALEGGYDKAIKSLSNEMPDDGRLSALEKALRKESQAVLSLRRSRASLVKKISKKVDYLTLQDAYWEQFLIKAHNVHLNRARKNIKQSEFGITKQMHQGEPEEALAKLRAFEESYCKKNKSYEELESALSAAVAESTAAEANLKSSLKEKPKLDELATTAVKAAKDLKAAESRIWELRELIDWMDDKQCDFEPGAAAMAKLRKKAIKGCFGDEKLATEMIRRIVGDVSNPGGFVIE